MQVVIRTLRVLSLIGEGRPQGLSLTEIGSELELPLPTVHRILKLLVAEGMVYRDEHSLQHFPGERLLRLARPAPDSMIGELSGPHIRSLCKRFNETVFVTQLIGPRAICVAIAESQRPLRISVDVGREMPLHAAASARVLLAYRDDSFVRSLLSTYDMVNFTPNTLTSIEEILHRLERIREHGFEISEDELDASIWAASIPIRPYGEVAASLTITAPVERSASPRLRESMLEGARDAAASVETAMRNFT